MRGVRIPTRALVATIALSLALAAAPSRAAAPLALLGKEIVQAIIRSLLEDALHEALLPTLGPCDGALASGALSTAQALAQMRGGAGMAGLPPMPGGVPTLPGGIPMGSAMSGVPGAMGMAGANAGGGAMGGIASSMYGVLGGQIAEMVEEQRRERREDQRRRGLTREQIEAEDREETEEARELDRMTFEMLESKQPLSSAELDEFVAGYAKLAALAPEEAQCSPASLRRALAPATVMPMAAGPIRSMLKGLREMERNFAEARRTYAAMSEAERAEHVELMLAELPEWEPEERKWFAALLRSDLLGMPAAMRAALEARLRMQ